MLTVINDYLELVITGEFHLIENLFADERHKKMIRQAMLMERIGVLMYFEYWDCGVGEQLFRRSFLFSEYIELSKHLDVRLLKLLYAVWVDVEVNEIRLVEVGAQQQDGEGE